MCGAVVGRQGRADISEIGQHLLNVVASLALDHAPQVLAFVLVVGDAKSEAIAIPTEYV